MNDIDPKILMDFEEKTRRFLLDYFEYQPGNAATLGLHQYQGLLPKLSKETVKQAVEMLKKYKVEFEKIDKNKLPADKKFELDLVLYEINRNIFELEEYKLLNKNIVVYAFMLGITKYFLKEYASPEIRAKHLLSQLKQTPEFLENAKNLITPPIGKPIQQITIQMLQGQLMFYEHTGKREAKTLAEKDPKLQEQLRQAFEEAINVINEFKEFVEKIETTEKFALGKEMFLKLQKYENAMDITLEELTKIAEEDLEKNSQEIKNIVEEHYPGKTIQQVIEDIKKNHPTKESLFKDTDNMLENLRTMIIEKEIVSVPSESRCKVIPTPEVYRSFAFAAMDPPGAFEVVADQAYYYVTPPEENWDEKQVEEWLTIFNYPQLEDISVHEAYPGHFLHFLHLRNIVKSRLAKIINSYHFVEGWAHYVEEIVYNPNEVGYRKDKPEYRIAQLLEALVRNARFLSSIKLHTQEGFTVEDSQKIFMEKAFLEPKPAMTEAMRGTFDPEYMNYTLGKLLILKLREDYFKENPKATLKQFNDELLKYGAPPIPILRKYMLKNNDGKLL